MSKQTTTKRLGKISEELYNRVMRAKGKMTAVATADLAGLSSGTVRRIWKTTDWDDFCDEKARIAEMHREVYSVKAEKVEPITVKAVKADTGHYGVAVQQNLFENTMVKAEMHFPNQETADAIFKVAELLGCTYNLVEVKKTGFKLWRKDK